MSFCAERVDLIMPWSTFTHRVHFALPVTGAWTISSGYVGNYEHNRCRNGRKRENQPEFHRFFEATKLHFEKAFYLYSLVHEL